MAKKKKQCSRCHEAIVTTQKKDKLHRPICPYCGYIEGDPVVPCVWTCEECGEIDIDHGTDKKPTCPDCMAKMSAVQARPSAVSGAGTGNEDLDLGLVFLLDAQSNVDFVLDIDPILKAQRDDLELGLELLRDALNE